MRRLDYRELMSLHREAQVTLIERCLEGIQETRTAMSQGDDYKTTINYMKQAIIEIRIGKKEAVAANWDELRRRG